MAKHVQSIPCRTSKHEVRNAIDKGAKACQAAYVERLCKATRSLLGFFTNAVVIDCVSTITPPKLLPKMLAVSPLVRAVE